MNKETKKNSETGLEIAIIGMSGRFPGAANIDQFWDNLVQGKESLSFPSAGELLKAGAQPSWFDMPNYVGARGGYLENKECFDAAFFGYTPQEALLMDPQARLFHECAWEALEEAGYDPGAYNKPIGLFAGASSSFYWESAAHLSPTGQQCGHWITTHLADKDYMVTRIAHKLALSGPAVNVRSACSTSMVAVHLACRALLTGDCHMALAGGVSINPARQIGYFYQEGAIFSRDGHCRAFDAQASGTIGGDGLGVVLLKPLKKAVADGDHIHAIIKGSAMNNDGAGRIGFTAPGVRGQTQVVRAALRFSRVPADTVGYVETHGTGTVIGDPIEIEALKKAFALDSRKTCAIGSVKTNVGHLSAASGITGLIKTILILKHRCIPPTLHYHEPNPLIDFDNSPFYVNNAVTEWQNPDHQPLRAGVSSFGIGGTNVHVVLENHIQTHIDHKGTANHEQENIILLSAMTPTALEQKTKDLVQFFRDHPGIDLADVAYTLGVGRRPLPYRRALVSSSVAEAIQVLSTTPASPAALSTGILGTSHLQDSAEKPVIFMFPGLGCQYVDMGRDLLSHEPIFREEVENCLAILEQQGISGLEQVLYPGYRSRPGQVASQASGDKGLNDPVLSQLALFIIEYAMARLLINWGISPTAMIGYSLGEYTAACISGVLSAADTLKLLVARGRFIQQTPPGAMLSVPKTRPEVENFISRFDHPGVSIAIDNGASSIVAGSLEAIESFAGEMRKHKILCLRLPSSLGIHSPLMESAAREFGAMFSQVRLDKPQVPYVSNVTGTWITPGEAQSPEYWQQHLLSTVHFARGLETLSREKPGLFLEVGPGRDLCVLSQRYIGAIPGSYAIDLVPAAHAKGRNSGYRFLLEKMGRLWLTGGTLSSQVFTRHGKRQRLSLPTYPFEGQDYWLDTNLVQAVQDIQASAMLEGEPECLDHNMATAKKTCAAAPLPSTPVEPTIARQPEKTRFRAAYCPPSNETEEKLAIIWQQLLGIEQVGINDDFYECGGDSIKAVALAHRLNQLGCPVALNDILEHSTIERLASLLSARALTIPGTPGGLVSSATGAGVTPSENSLDCIESLNSGCEDRDIFIMHPLHGMVNQYKSLAVLLEGSFHVFGVQAAGVKPGTELSSTPQQMIKEYIAQIQAAHKNGPYIIAGYCIGNMIAYYVALELERSGHKVDKVILINSQAFFTPRMIGILRTPAYFSRAAAAMIRFFYNRRFKKRQQTLSVSSGEGRDRAVPRAGNEIPAKEIMQKHLRVLADHAVPTGIISAPLLVLTAAETGLDPASVQRFKKMTRTDALVLETPGAHETLFQQPYVEHLASLIRAHT